MSIEIKIKIVQLWDNWSIIYVHCVDFFISVISKIGLEKIVNYILLYIIYSAEN